MMRRSGPSTRPLIQAWHGSRRWDGSPELRPGRTNRVEWGPGIYASTDYMTALKYAKGGGMVRLLQFEPRLFLEQAALALPLATQLVQDVAPKRAQGALIDRMAECAERASSAGRVKIGLGPHLHAEVLRNLLTHDNLCIGKRGLALAEFYASHGIDAAADRVSGQEFWTVIFNPRCVRSWEPVSSRQVTPEQMTLANPYLQQAEQTAVLALARSNGDVLRRVPVESPADAARLYMMLLRDAGYAPGEQPSAWLGPQKFEADGSLWAGSIRVLAPQPLPEASLQPLLTQEAPSGP